MAGAEVRRRGRRLWRIALITGVVATVLGAAGSWIPSFWGDEAASIMSASRTWPELWRMLLNVDGVHGVYYAFLHLWIGAFGASEFSVRLPSAIAAGFVAAGTAVLAGRLGGARLALVTGLVAAALPRTTLMAAEGRSYAIGSAIAVWLTVLLIALLARRRPWWAWACYALGLAAAVYVFLYLVLLVLVHGLFLLLHRGRFGRWAAAAGTGVALALPIVLLAASERAQIGFLSGHDYLTPFDVLALQWFDPVLAIPCWALILIGLSGALRARRTAPRRLRLAVLATIWLVLPTTAIAVASVVIAPMYTVRYLSFCTPAAAILIGFGVQELGCIVARRHPTRTPVATGIALAVLLAAFIPGWVVQREPFAKDGSDWREAADQLHAQASAGAAVVFDERPKNSEKPRLILATYPAAFADLRDPALLVPFRERPGLWDETRPNDSLTVDELGPDVWAVERGSAPADSPDARHLQALGYRIVSAHRVNVTTLLHLER